MYRLITFRSRELKKNTIKLAAENTAADFRAENSVYVINGLQVNEEDLTRLEKEDISAAKEFNTDGFYTSPEVLDINEIKINAKSNSRRFGKKKS